MKTLSTIIATLLTLAMLAIIPMALTGNMTFGANAGHPPVNGLAVVSASVNPPAAATPDISGPGLVNSALEAIGLTKTTDFVGHGNISAAIGATK